jgi:type I restriction enzyme S subunit
MAILKDAAGNKGILSDGDWILSEDMDANGKVGVIQLKHVGVGVFLQKDFSFISEETFTRLKCTEVLPGDVLISRMADPIGRACIVPQMSFRCVTAVDVTILRTDSDVAQASYIQHLCNSRFMRKRIERAVRGATRPRITRTELEEIEVPLPPLSEQQRIAAILDRADRLRRTRRYAAQLSETFLQAVFVRMFGDPVKNEMGWEVFRLEDIAQINPATPKAREFSDADEVSFIPMAAVDEKIFTTQTNEVRKYKEVSKNFTVFQENDVLFAKITPCMENGKIVLAKNLLSGVGFGSTEFHVIRNAERTMPEWLLWLVRRKEFRNLAVRAFTGTAGQQRVPASFLESYVAPLPPLRNVSIGLAQLFSEFTEVVSSFRSLVWAD